MVKKVIGYEDIDGNRVSEEYLFSLSKADCADLDFYYEDKGGLKAYLKSLIKYENPDDIPKKPLWEFLKVVVAKAVGKRDGKRLVKSKDIQDDFFYTNAFSEFLEDLMSNTGNVSAFLEGVLPNVPDDVKANARAELEREGIKLPT